MSVTILAVDPRWRDPIRLALMREYLPEGFELVIPASFDHATLLREAHTASVLLTGQAPLTAAMIAAAPHLRLIGKIGTGVDSIDLAAATAAGIPVAHAPGWMRATSVAEHVFLLMLTLARRPWLWHGSGTARLHVPLEGSSLGIIGLGAIGQRVARRAASFDMTILAYTRTPGTFHPDGFHVEEVSTLPDLLSRADFVVLTLPLTPATRGLIGAPELACMRSSAMLINVSRGRHVVTDALVEALQTERIAGAGLDVTDPEPLPTDHVLRTFPNVILSPHVAGQSESVQRQSVKLLCDSIRLAVHGERVPSLANPEVYQRA